MAPVPQITLTLAKFSFATTSYEYALPLPWTHLMSENNLLAIFELCSSQISVGSQIQNHRFKILNNSEILVRNIWSEDVITDIIRRISTS